MSLNCQRQSSNQNVSVNVTLYLYVLGYVMLCLCVRFSVRDAVTVCVCLLVYVMLAESFEFRALLDALKGRGLLETGEYIVLGVDSKHYDSKDPQKYIAGTTRATEYVPPNIGSSLLKVYAFGLPFALRNRVVSS